jgi:hypothetical protein
LKMVFCSLGLLELMLLDFYLCGSRKTWCTSKKCRTWVVLIFCNLDAAVHVKDNLNELFWATQLIYRHVLRLRVVILTFTLNWAIKTQLSAGSLICFLLTEEFKLSGKWYWSECVRQVILIRAHEASDADQIVWMGSK